MLHTVKCPHCQSYKRIELTVADKQLVGRVYDELEREEKCRVIHPNVCLNCGTVYVSEYDLQHFRQEG